ncbi:putative Pentapeptide repeat protein [Desulfamplus magnetovallimortis]|uniref:Putative Pentapeptide repeat protein n=1 Tax=Desulfamplus magnetovallimortis TaxID=1246637 RepID=L0R4N1_9BACT|nr:DUF2169 domain-containing protein [Desulfamplus magnetovallimortis]CCO06829.1 putative Pentapeptide repeat protein [Desulfamplus magnetovallimortis BW-1]SLM32880.1 putative Pentapeptide repeat protein [Desulfamplus magnetovallimortis]
MNIIRPLQIFANNQVIEQHQKFYLVVSASLGISLQTGEALLDVYYLKDIFESMDQELPLPDMAMPKPNGEFLVTGSYHAPDKRAVTGGEATVSIGNKQKSLYIFGPRKWQSGRPSNPTPFTSMPINYKNAFGGMEYDRNPEGIGFNDGLLPCIEHPRNLVISQKDKPEPAGFSPLHPMLPQRMKYQGTYDSTYRTKFFPGYPDDHDWRYFLCAPDDQWIDGYFNGNELFSINNMHPDIPLLKGQLPGLYARCFVNHNKAGNTIFGELPLNMDTIWFFPEKLLAMTIFRGVMEVEDDEADTVSHLLLAYEEKSSSPRTSEYYKTALERRINSDDRMLNNLATGDLVPEGHKSPMKVLIDTAVTTEEKNELVKNIDTKITMLEKKADEKIEESIQQIEKNIAESDLPDMPAGNSSPEIPAGVNVYGMPGQDSSSKSTDHGKLDIRKMVTRKADASPDPEMEQFKTTLDNIIPGITSGDLQKMDLTNFSSDSLDKIFEALGTFTEKKEEKAKELSKNEIKKGKKEIEARIQDVERQIEETRKIDKPGLLDGTSEVDTSEHSDDTDNLQSLENRKKKLLETLDSLNTIDLDNNSTPPMPLPRIDIEKIRSQAAPEEINPRIIEAMAHIQAQKSMGMEDEKTEELEKQIQEMMQTYDNVIHERLNEAKSDFMETYRMGAHFMGEGLSPHKEELAKVRQDFLEALSNGETLSGKDFACIDLSGEILDGINLSGALLEQVNFKGASLKGANFSGAILARANLEGADLSDADLTEANVGAVSAKGANFSGACMKSAKLSKGDFTDSDFSRCDLSDIECLEIKLNGSNFTDAKIPGILFLEITLSRVIFKKAIITSSAFFKCAIKQCDFTEAIMDKSAFVDCQLSETIFNGTSLSNGCFVATESGKSVMEQISFKNSCLKQANFQNMKMQSALLSGADLENAFFGGADLSRADLSKAFAKNTQFRKTILTNATLDDINLMQGSLAKARLTDASIKRANLYQVDFLRSTITRTDFSGSNLDNTLIEQWRPQ